MEALEDLDPRFAEKKALLDTAARLNRASEDLFNAAELEGLSLDEMKALTAAAARLDHTCGYLLKALERAPGMEASLDAAA